jgi:LDH2 family malate/lactate/ureidoglycolate dehydrogenase
VPGLAGSGGDLLHETLAVAMATGYGLVTRRPQLVLLHAGAGTAAPVGGAKGAGMSLVFDLPAGCLTANPIVSAYHADTPEGRRHRQNATMIAVDVSAFVPDAEFISLVDETLDAVKALPVRDEAREPLVPGERGDRALRERTVSGVPVPPKVWANLTDEASAAGVAVPDLSRAHPEDGSP